MKVFIEQIPDYDLEKIRMFLENTFTSIDLWQKLKLKKTILLKPNLLGPYDPDRAITTHPAILEALIQLLLAERKEIWIGDGPGGSLPVKKTWEKTGIRELSEKYGIKLVNFNTGGVRSEEVNGINFTTSNYFWEADAVINIAKYKTHSLTYYTGAVKNLYGVIPGLKKSEYHSIYPDTKGFSLVLTALYKLLYQRIDLNLLDGIWGMEGEGPSAGEKRNFGIMMISESAAALDVVAAGMMGFTENQLNYIYKSLEMENINPSGINLEEKWQDFKFDRVKIKGVSNMIKMLAYSPEFLKSIFRKIYKFYPDFNDNCRLCRVCAESCPVNAIYIGKNSTKPVLDQQKCIKCLCCQELCPYGAVYIKKSLLAKLLIK